MNPPWKEVKNIVILNLIANTVGDTLMMSPLIQILKRNSPQARVICTASPQNAPLLNGLPDLLVPIPELADIGAKTGRFGKAFRYLSLMRRCVRLLREVKADVCIVVQPNFAPSQLIPWLAGVPCRIGYTYKGSRFSWALTHKVDWKDAYATGDYKRHFIETVFDLVRCVDVPIRKEDSFVKKIVTDDAKVWADAYLKKAGVKKTDLLIAFQAGAKWINKQWPADRYAEVAAWLVKDYNAKILLFGTQEEKPINDIVAAAAEGRAIRVLGEHIENVSALLQRCKLALGNSSGIMHLASAVGTPSAMIHGIGVASNSEPRGPGGSIRIEGPVYKENPALSGNDVEEGIRRMGKITVAQVKASLKKALK